MSWRFRERGERRENNEEVKERMIKGFFFFFFVFVSSLDRLLIMTLWNYCHHITCFAFPFIWSLLWYFYVYPLTRVFYFSFLSSLFLAWVVCSFMTLRRFCIPSQLYFSFNLQTPWYSYILHCWGLFCLFYFLFFPFSLLFMTLWRFCIPSLLHLTFNLPTSW